METNLVKFILSSPLLVNYNFPLAVLIENNEGNHNYVYPEGILTTYPMQEKITLVRKELKDTSIRSRIIYI